MVEKHSHFVENKNDIIYLEHSMANMEEAYLYELQSKRCNWVLINNWLRLCMITASGMKDEKT